MTGDPSIEPLFERGDWVETKPELIHEGASDSPRKVTGWEWNSERNEWDIKAEYIPLSGEWGTGGDGKWPESRLVKVDPPPEYKNRLILHIEVPGISADQLAEAAKLYGGDVCCALEDEIIPQIGLSFVTTNDKIAVHLGTLRNAEIKVGEETF